MFPVPAPPGPVTAITGDSLTLQCDATGFPAPTISWYKGGDQVVEDSRITIATNSTGAGGPVAVTSTFTITGVQLQDEGDYTCQAENSVTAVSTLILEVTVAGE